MVEESAASEGPEANQDLTPWEHHSAVIRLPRFDYKAPSSLLENSHAGFLITCPIRREKSATKEAISILDKYLRSLASDGFEKLESSDVNVAAKKRKICLEKIEGEDTNCSEESNSVSEAGNFDEGENKSGSVPLEETQNAACGSSATLSLVKLTGSGLLLFTFPRYSRTQTADILSDIFNSLNSGSLRPPQWCHRILPIQATCSLKEDNLREIVSKLVQQFLEDDRHKHGKPIKLVVFVELLPLSRLPQGTPIAAVSVLPQNLVATKPRISVKSLISDSKTKKQS
ncbi:uncharacterized protein [Aristolochia californica]|uniref:uncharacterized protein isoform X2 n=1 Tax=Aristolochia californica TaxID=171875 RepID=UPI0035D9CA4D